MAHGGQRRHDLDYFRPTGSVVTYFCDIYGSHKLTIVNEYKYFFVSHICPILEYCPVIWRMKHYDPLERAQLNALRYFLRVQKCRMQLMIFRLTKLAGLVVMLATSWQYYVSGIVLFTLHRKLLDGDYVLLI